MASHRALLLAVLLVVSMVALPLSAGGLAAPDTVSPGGDSLVTADVDRVADPSTEDTIGYVEGYWYDDELSVDDSDGATLSEDELEEVIYRSMARVEVIRDLPFKREVPVEVLSRAEYQEDEALFDNISDEDAFTENVRLEALFMADRDTDAFDAWNTLYGDSVGGFYEPGVERIVLVSDSPDEPEVDEVTLGHELLHALQDQHFDLTTYDRDTSDLDIATNGLVEGDAVWVDTEYEARCESDWPCTIPDGSTGGDIPDDFNWGLYFSIFQPYNDGPDYVEYYLEDGDWSAVDALYDDPPSSSSEVIRPGDDREPAAIEVEDRSGDDWEQYTVDGEPASDTIGEAGIVSMFGDGANTQDESVLELTDFINLADGTINYDQPYTDGWAGDELVVYRGPGDSVEDSGYVWETEWTSEEDAEAFLDGYLTLLAIHGAEANEVHQNTFEIDDGYPGAYAIDHDGETVTIVRGPTVDDLSEIESGAAPEGEDTMVVEDGDGFLIDDSDDRDTNGAGDDADDERVGDADDVDDTADADDTDVTDDAHDTDDTDDATDADDADTTDDTIPGFAVVPALIAIAGAVVIHRRRE